MCTLLAVWSFETTRRLFQIGIIAAGVGGGFIGLGTIGVIARRWGPARPAASPPPGASPRPGASAPAASGGFIVNPALAIASILLVAGFILMLLSVHYGVQPFSPRK